MKQNSYKQNSIVFIKKNFVKHLYKTLYFAKKFKFKLKFKLKNSSFYIMQLK